MPLTSVLKKCFEWLMKDYICSSLPSTLDPLQFAYRPNQSTEDAIAHILHAALSHLDNTIVHSRLVTKLKDLGLNTSLCKRVLDFLTGRLQVVRMGRHTSSIIILEIGAPQGCVLSPLLNSLYTQLCSHFRHWNTIKCVDDTAVVGRITDNNEKAYLEEVEDLTRWCQDNNLLLNISKTKELIVDFGKKQGMNYTPLTSTGPLWRGWAVSNTLVSTSPRA